MKKGVVIVLIVLFVFVVLVILLTSLFLYPKLTGKVVSGDGLVAFYKFENNMNDDTGNNNGVNYGASFASGKKGMAADFDGVNDYVNISDSNSLDITNAITISAWIKADSFVNEYPRILAKNNAYDLYLNASSRKMQFVIYNQSASRKTVKGNTILSANIWYHVAGVYHKDTGFKLYINGSEESLSGDTGFRGNIRASVNNLLIGNFEGLIRYRSFNGSIDEVKVWNRALSASEIRAEYEGGPVICDNNNICEEGETAENCQDCKCPVIIYPGEDIQAIVNKSAEGTTFILKAGIYRLEYGKYIRPKNNDVFIGETGAIISGARVLNDFSREPINGYWVALNQMQEGRYGGKCMLRNKTACKAEIIPGSTTHCSGSPFEGNYADPCLQYDVCKPYNRCDKPNDLFFDNKPLLHAFSISELSEGKWYFDYDNNKIYLYNNPSGHNIETSVSPYAFYPEYYNYYNASNVTIRNLKIEKFASNKQDGAVSAAYGENWTIENNEVLLSHNMGVRIGKGAKVLNNNLHDNGQYGFGGLGNNSLIEGNEVAYNNFAWILTAWGAGAAKIVRSNNVIMRDNYVHDNMGNGLWTDEFNDNITYENNIVINNYNEGIMNEISYSTIIRNNTLIGNGAGIFPDGMGYSSWLWGSQILISSSDGAEIYDNNVVVGASGGNGITIVQQNRREGNVLHLSYNNHVYNNSIYYLENRGLSGAANDTYINPDIFWISNSFDYNTYYVNALNLGGRRWAWNGLNDWITFVNRGQEAHGTATTISCDSNNKIRLTFPRVNVVYNCTSKNYTFEVSGLEHSGPVEYIAPDCRSEEIVELKFDENSGNIAYDSSTHSNNGNVYGASWSEGINGSALSFDGNDYVEVADSASLDITNAITISAWIKADSFINTYPRILAKKNAYDLYLNASTRKLQFAIYNQSGSRKTVEGNTSLSRNVWYYVTGVYNNDTGFKIYANGNEESLSGDMGTRGKIITNNDKLYISNLSGFLRYFNGTIDEVKIWNRALSASEIRAEYEYFASCNTDADNPSINPGADCNGIVDRGELGNYIVLWTQGIVTRSELANAIMAWAT